MSRTTKLVGMGIAPLTAGQIVGDLQTGITAAGTTFADATAVSGDVVVVTTTAASTGVILSGPGFGAGDTVLVVNQGANAVAVYPPAGGKINALATNAGFIVGAGKAAVFVCASATQFYSLLGA